MWLKNKHLFFLLFACAWTYTTQAQQLEGAVDFHGFADNREYNASGRYPQTIFGARITPEIGLAVDSVHRIRVGVSYLQEFGDKNLNKPIKAVAYYNYRDKGFDFKIGMFPRHQYLDEYPRAILSDTINYYQPNIEGMLLKYKNSHFTQQLWIDWNSRQTRSDREQFMVGLSGQVNLSPILFFQNHAVLWHNAGKMFDESAEDYVQDNGAAAFHMGVNLSNLGWLDSIRVTTGYIVNYNRIRKISQDWDIAQGSLSEIYVEHKRFFVRDTYYAGQSLILPYGDVFYSSKRYNRLEMGWIPLKSKNLEGRFIASFHFSEGVVDNQQQFLLRYLIDYGKKR